jgi:hypothetical protein
MTTPLLHFQPIALPKVDAAAALGMSTDSFERYVMADVRCIRRMLGRARIGDGDGRRMLFPPVYGRNGGRRTPPDALAKVCVPEQGAAG